MAPDGQANGSGPAVAPIRLNVGATTERLRPIAFAVLTAFLVALCALVASPFLSALTWAAALAVLAVPAHSLLARRTGRPTLAALVTTIVIGAVVVGTVLFLAYQIVREAGTTDQSKPVEDPAHLVQEARVRSPALGQVAVWADRAGFDLEGEVRETTAKVASQARDIARGSPQIAAQLAIAFFLLFYFLRDRRALLEAVRGFLPLSHAEADRVLSRTADAVRANLYANGATSSIDAVVGGLVFWAAGLPAPALWGAAIFVFSLIPPFGATIVWVPATVYLALTDHWPEAGGVLAFGLFTLLVVDNLLYARLAGGRSGMHPAVALMAVLGGLAVFGAAGLVLGPAAVAVTIAVFEVWRARRATVEGEFDPDCIGSIVVPRSLGPVPRA